MNNQRVVNLSLFPEALSIDFSFVHCRFRSMLIEEPRHFSREHLTNEVKRAEIGQPGVMFAERVLKFRSVKGVYFTRRTVFVMYRHKMSARKVFLLALGVEKAFRDTYGAEPYCVPLVIGWVVKPCEEREPKFKDP